MKLVRKLLQAARAARLGRKAPLPAVAGEVHQIEIQLLHVANLSVSFNGQTVPQNRGLLFELCSSQGPVVR